MVRVAEAFVAISQIGCYPLMALFMRGVVGVGDGELFEHAELSLNQVEPGGLRGRPNGMDMQPLEEVEEAGMVVDEVEVVQYDK